MNLGGYSATGPRDTNEDSHFECSFPSSVTFLNDVDTFVMVSDGMGGYEGGDVASSLTTSSAERYLQNLFDMANGKTIEFKPDVALAEIVGNAHEAIVAETHARNNASMGATFVGAFISPTHAWIGHVGDSRAYVIRNGEAHQLTVDHSHVGRLLSGGVITEEEAQNHPGRNKIERALGFENHAMEVTETDLLPGDVFLLCSDGLYTVLDKRLLASTCMQGHNAQESAQLVVEKALANGTDDNTTAVVAYRPSDAASVASARSTQPTVIRQAPVHAAGKWPDADDGPRGSVQGGVQGNTQRNAQRNVQGKTPDPEDSIRTQRIRPVERPDAAQQPTLRRQGKNAESRRRPRPSASAQKPRRPLVAIVVPIAIFVVLIGVVVWLFVVSRTSPTETTAVTSPMPQTEPTTQTEPTIEEEPSPTHSSQRYVEDVETSSTYETTEDAVLRYVDKDGVAQQFTDLLPAGTVAPYVPTGSVVRATSVEDSFNRLEQTYRMLDDKYLDDLQNDLAMYRQGMTEFSSDLSRIVESASYKELLEALRGMSETSLETEIRGLLLRSQDLTSSAAGTSSYSGAQGGARSTRVTGQLDETGTTDADAVASHSNSPDAGAVYNSTSSSDTASLSDTAVTTSLPGQ